MLVTCMSADCCCCGVMPARQEVAETVVLGATAVEEVEVGCVGSGTEAVGKDGCAGMVAGAEGATGVVDVDAAVVVTAVVSARATLGVE